MPESRMKIARGRKIVLLTLECEMNLFLEIENVLLILCSNSGFDESKQIIFSWPGLRNGPRF